MKKNDIKLLTIEISLILFSLFCIFFANMHSYLYIFLVSVIAGVLYFIFKPEHRKERFHTDLLLLIIISIMFYYAITYFAGFFTGFFYTNYSRSLKGMFINVTTTLIIMYAIETIREVLVKNGKYNKLILIIVPIVCTLLELPSHIILSLNLSRIDMFSAILQVIVPCFIKNIFLTYITYLTNKNNSLLYQYITIMPNYFLPVFPNLGDFFRIVVDTLLPIMVFMLSVNFTTIKNDKIKNSRKLNRNKILIYCSNTLVFTIILILLYLTSNMFRFTSLAIGSSSMQGSLNKGDIVIIDKKERDFKKGDIIAFKEDGKLVVHRVIKVYDETNKMYQTKGDANNKRDAWIVTKKSSFGKVVFRVRWLGWPTIALSELLSK
ncbi:MAG: signal peptidase I [Bacilli bacterium]|nr:signal peptidase I [Bacilli bacterium]